MGVQKYYVIIFWKSFLDWDFSASFNKKAGSLNEKRLNLAENGSSNAC